MAIGRSIGKASITIVPDASGFRSQARRDVEAATAGLTNDIKVKLDLDTNQLVAKLRAITSRAYTITVNVEANTTQALNALQRLRARAQGMPAKMRITTDMQMSDLRVAQREASAYFRRNPVRALIEFDFSAASVARARSAAQQYFTRNPVRMPVELILAPGEIARFRAEVQARLAAMRNLRVVIDVDMNRSLFASLTRDLNSLGSSARRNGSLLNTFAGRLQLIIAAILAATPTVLSMVNALKLMTGALAAGPSLLLGFGATLGVLKMAFGDIMKEIEDAGKKGGVALTGPIKVMAASIAVLQSKMLDLRDTIRGAVLPGFSALTATLSGVPFDTFASGMTAFARGVSAGMTSLSQMLNSTPAVANFGKAMQIMATAVQPAAVGIGNLVRIFLAFAAGAAPTAVDWIERLAAWLGRLAAKTEELAANGTINRWAEQGGEAVLSFIRSLARVVSAINDIANMAPSGFSFLNGFESASKAIKNFTENAEAMATITAIFDAINQALERAGNLIQAWGPSVGRVLVAVISAATPVVDAFTRILIEIGKVVDAITSIPGFVTALGAILFPIFAFALAFSAVSKAVAIVVAGLKILKGIMIVMRFLFFASPIGVVVGLIIALALAFKFAYDHSETFRNAVNNLWQAVKDAAVAVWGWITGTLVPGLAAAWDAIWQGMTIYFNLYRTIFTTTWDAIASITKAVWNGIRGYFSAWFSGVRGLFSAYFNGYRSVVTTVWNALRTITTTVWNAIRAVITAVLNGIRSVVTAVVNGIRSVVTGGWSNVRSNTVSAWNSIRSAVTTAVNNVRSAVSSGFSAVVSAVRNGMSQAYSAVRNAVGNFVSAGRDLVAGIARGIASGLGGVVSAAVNVVKNAVAAARNAIVSNSPSKLTAQVIGLPMAQGIAVGIYEDAKNVANAMKTVVTKAIAAVNVQRKIQVPINASVSSKAATARSTQAALDRETKQYKDALYKQSAQYLKYQQAMNKARQLPSTTKAQKAAKAAATNLARREYDRYLALKKQTLAEKRQMVLAKLRDTAADKALKAEKAKLAVQQKNVAAALKAVDAAKAQQAAAEKAVKEAAKAIQEVPDMPDVYDPGLVQMVFGPAGKGTMTGEQLAQQPYVKIENSTFGYDPDEVAIAINRNQRRTVSLMGLQMAGVTG